VSRIIESHGQVAECGIAKQVAATPAQPKVFWNRSVNKRRPH
jgi:hypothetical protein